MFRKHSHYVRCDTGGSQIVVIGTKEGSSAHAMTDAVGRSNAAESNNPATYPAHAAEITVGKPAGFMQSAYGESGRHQRCKDDVNADELHGLSHS
jgi:hypothetical protein